MYKINILDKISIILIIIGALNWGLFGLANIDIINLIFGGTLPIISRILYILIGLSAINMILLIIKLRKDKI